MTNSRRCIAPIQGINICIALMVIFLSGCSSAPGIATYDPPPDHRVIQNVHVVDVANGKIIENQDLWTRGGLIEAIVPTGAIRPDAGSQIFPADGRYILPGLIDGHVHAESGISPLWKFSLPDVRFNLERMLYGGATTIIDLGGSLSELEQARGYIESGRYHGPDIIYSGPGITTVDGHPSQLTEFLQWPISTIARKHVAVEVSNKEDVSAALENAKRRSGTIAKIMLDEIPVGAPRLSPALLKHAVERAHAMGLKVAVHVGTNADAGQAIEAGADYLAHNVYRERISEDTISLMKSHNVKVMTTLGAFHRYTEVHKQQPVTWTAMTKELSDPEILASIFQQPAPEEFSIPENFGSYFDSLVANRETRDRNAVSLREAGVEIIVGSDSPGVGWQAGAALIEELKLLAGVGYSAAQIVRAVTIDNARHLGFKDRGILEPNLRADLLLLNANPLESVDAFDQIEAVFVKGSQVERKPLN
jgi:imidazolonepropionase-like amidohydrolase